MITTADNREIKSLVMPLGAAWYLCRVDGFTNPTPVYGPFMKYEGVPGHPKVTDFIKTCPPRQPSGAVKEWDEERWEL